MSSTAHLHTEIASEMIPVPVVAPANGPKAAQARAATKQSWTVTRLDRLAGGRNNVILVHVANPKKPGTHASDNWSLYGKIGVPTVTVDDFLKSYPASAGGLTRARTSLAWDINYGYVSVINLATGEVLTACETA